MRTEVEVKVRKFKNGKAAGRDDVTEEMVKGRGDMVVACIWRLCNMIFKSGFGSEDWRSSMIVPLYKGKGETIECKNYSEISLLSLDRVRRVTEGLIDDKQGGFRSGRGCVDQIFALKQIIEKAGEKKRRVYVGFMDLEKEYDRFNREAANF